MHTQDKKESLFCLAQDRGHQSDIQGAIDALKRLLQIDFNHIDAHKLLGHLYYKDENYELSILHYEKAIELAGEEEQELLKNIAKACSKLHLHKVAIYALQKYLRFDIHDSEAYNLLAKIYLVQEEPTYALKVLKTAIALDPKKAAYYFSQATAYSLLQNSTDALLSIQKALALEQKEAKYYALQANLYLKLNQPNKAKEAWFQASKLDAQNRIYQQELQRL